jgi:hypothetical protein
MSWKSRLERNLEYLTAKEEGQDPFPMKGLSG